MRPLILPPQSAQERWRQVPGHPTYFASNLGHVWSARAGRVLKPDTASRRYHRYDLRCENGKRVRRDVHHLVASAWLGERPEGLWVLHVDDNPDNNAASNLYFGDASDNLYDRVANGNHHEANKTHCPIGHPYDDANTYVFNGKRHCRACRRVAARAASE